MKSQVVQRARPLRTSIQLFRQGLCHKSIKAYATMLIDIMSRKSLPLIDWGSRCLPNNIYIERRNGYSLRGGDFLSVPRLETRFMKDSLAYRGIVLWNTICLNENGILHFLFLIIYTRPHKLVDLSFIVFKSRSSIHPSIHPSKREGIYTSVCAVFLYVPETPKASIKDQEPPLPVIPFGIVAYGFIGQPFSKQLYAPLAVKELTYNLLHGSLPKNGPYILSNVKYWTSQTFNQIHILISNVILCPCELNFLCSLLQPILLTGRYEDN